MKIAYIFLNGELLGAKEYYLNFIKLWKGDIFCADGGANICKNLELDPLEIWGDLDSIEKEVLEYYSKKDIKIKKFPTEKDKTDSELLLEYINNKYDRIYCIGGLGGALDHELSNINLSFKYNKLYFLTEKEIVFKFKNKYEFKGLKNRKISFIIFSNEIVNLTLEGFKYDVKNLTLQRGDSRCISNIIVEDNSYVSLKEGDLLVILKNKIDLFNHLI